MRQNHVADVAKMFGVKLNEVFAVCNSVDDKIEYFRFTINGMEHFIAEYRGSYNIGGHRGNFNRTDTYLEPLILGKIWIKEDVEQGALF